MTPFPDYNPNYEERRGSYAPADAQHRLEKDGEAAGNRQNAAATDTGISREAGPDDRHEQASNEEA